MEQLVRSSQSGEFQQITEQTQRIIEQIQSQLDSQAASQPDGQPLQVAYQIIHDDDNQQVLEIQYHQVMEVEDSVQATNSKVLQDEQGTREDEQSSGQKKSQQGMMQMGTTPNQPNTNNLRTQVCHTPQAQVYMLVFLQNVAYICFQDYRNIILGMLRDEKRLKVCQLKKTQKLVCILFLELVYFSAGGIIGR